MGGAEAIHLLEETRSMTHGYSPLTPAGRLRLVQRVVDDGRPIAHVAAEAGIARSTLTKWLHGYRADGAEALQDRSSAPSRRPSRPPIEVLKLIDSWRREHKWSARRIALELADRGHHYCVRSIGRWLQRLGISHRRGLDPTGENSREPGKIIAHFPGDILHLDVKKVGQIPGGGGRRLHGRGSKRARHQRVGYNLPALRDRQLFPTPLHRDPRERDRGNDHCLLHPGQGFLRCSRHHAPSLGGHR